MGDIKEGEVSKIGKNSTKKRDFYLALIGLLKQTSNLGKIQLELKLSKQNLNYYLRRLRLKGYVVKKGQGLWELTESGKNLTKYDSLLKQDISRGHAYVWEVELPKIPDGWDKRIEKLNQKGIHFKLVGAKLDIPRIKVLGRKVWLCNNHLRIFEKKDKSYYGENAVESRKQAFYELLDIIRVVENKLGTIIRPFNWKVKKEHYALIKNDLAKESNRQGEVIRVKDETGEWLLVDDSLGEGGELETEGKKALPINIEMQKWWNENKETKFKVTPNFILESLGKMIQIQQMNSQNIIKHQKVLDEMLVTLKLIQAKL